VTLRIASHLVDVRDRGSRERPSRSVVGRPDHPVGITAALRQIPPGPDQSFLDRIARELAVPEDESGDLVQRRDSSTDELGEGVMITLPRPLHEPSLVHGPTVEPSEKWIVP
jgi:hypothetical protein